MELSIKSKSGVSMVVKAPSAETKAVWITALESQINAIDQKIANAARAISAEDEALTVRDGSSVGTIVIPSVALKEADQEFNPPTTSGADSHPLLAPFMTRGDSSRRISAPLPLNNAQVSTKPTPDNTPVKASDPSEELELDAVINGGSTAPVPEPVEFQEDDNDEDEPVQEYEEEDEEDSEDEDDEEEGEEDDGRRAATVTAADGSPIPVRTVNLDLSPDVVGGFGPANAGARSWSKRNPKNRASSGKDDSARMKRKYKFGIQPDVIVSVEDFGCAPELLTTAQKVAILESQAFQNKNFSPVLPPAAKAGVKPTTYTALSLPTAPSRAQRSNASASASAASDAAPGDAGYVPTGLRVNELDKEATNVENDGGPVAKTKDKLMDKISKWEDWTKNIGTGTGKSPVKQPPK
jgi:hypothetical protein